METNFSFSLLTFFKWFSCPSADKSVQGWTRAGTKLRTLASDDGILLVCCLMFCFDCETRFCDGYCSRFMSNFSKIVTKKVLLTKPSNHDDGPDRVAHELVVLAKDRPLHYQDCVLRFQRKSSQSREDLDLDLRNRVSRLLCTITTILKSGLRRR